MTSRYLVILITDNNWSSQMISGPQVDFWLNLFPQTKNDGGDRNISKSLGLPEWSPSKPQSPVSCCLCLSFVDLIILKKPPEYKREMLILRETRWALICGLNLRGDKGVFLALGYCFNYATPQSKVLRLNKQLEKGMASSPHVRIQLSLKP